MDLIPLEDAAPDIKTDLEALEDANHEPAALDANPDAPVDEAPKLPEMNILPADKALYDDIEIELTTTAVKALDETGERVGGYLVVFGNAQQRDLSPWNNKDGSKGEFFTKSTDLCQDWLSVRPALYHHGLDASAKTSLIGSIDKLRVDDVGVWAEAQINKRNKYAKAVAELVKTGKLSWSSGALPHLVIKADNGEIKRWPLIEGSLTPTPMEPRNTHISSAKALSAAYKALNLPTDKLEIEPDSAPRSDQEIARTAKADAKPSVLSNKSLPSKDIQMDEKELQALIEAGVQKTMKAHTDAAEAAKVAAAAEEARIEAEVARRVATKALPARGAFPVPPAPGANPAAAPARTTITVNEDPRYANLNSEDMSFLTDVYSHVLTSTTNPTADNSLYAAAYAFVNKAGRDENRSLQRQIAAKALREHERGELPDATLTYLPYKRLEDVYANNYDTSAQEAAIKSNELENAGQTGFGIEWVPTIWSQNLWRRVRISNPVAANMQVIEMPSNPYNLPVESTDPTVYNIAEATDLTQLVLTSANTITTGKVASGKQQMTAAKLGTRVAFSTELMEDSIIPVLPMYRYQVQRALENYVDDTILNGDTTTSATTNVNIIDGTPTTGNSFLAFNGLRKYCLVTNTAQKLDAAGASPSLTLMRNTRKLLSKQYGIDIPNLLYIVNWETYLKMLAMPEYATWQHLGMAGSAVTGVLPNGQSNQVQSPSPVGIIDGIPVYVTAQLAQTETSGKINGTPSATLYGTAILYHRSRWMLGYRRQITMDMFPQSIFSDTYQIWATVRCTVQSFDTASAALLYDIAN